MNRTSASGLGGAAPGDVIVVGAGPTGLMFATELALAGARPLVEVKGGDKMAIVIQEILQDKIFLDASGHVQTRGTGIGDAARRAMLSDISDMGGGDD